MKPNKSTRYALYAALEMAAAGEAPVTAAHVAERYEIPPAVMAKVFQQMARSGLAVGIRGVRGGYRLARSPAVITVLEVLDAFEPARLPGQCLLAGPGSRECREEHEVCRLRALFDEVDEMVRCTFASVSLATLAGVRSARVSRRA